jgi:mobA/mobL family protein
MTDSIHYKVKIVSRGKGKSAVASAAYQACETLTNEWDGVTHDYQKKKGLLFQEILLPSNAPPEYQDRGTLWNSVELYEKAKNAQLARNIVIALPKELSLEENKQLIRELIQKDFVSKGMIADSAIHDESDEGNHNIHAHVMLTLRFLKENGTWGEKSRKEYVFDKEGNPVLTANGKQKTRKIELTDWNEKGNVERWRESYAALCNRYFKDRGIQKQVDHRSYEKQGIERIPTIHMGAATSALERKGIAREKALRQKRVSSIERLRNKIVCYRGFKRKSNN